MNERVPHAESPATGPGLTDVAGLTFARPKGDPSVHAGAVSIGAIVITKAGMLVIPRNSINHDDRRQLRSAALWAMMTGPRGNHWLKLDGAGWVSAVSVPQEPDSPPSSVSSTLRRSSSDGRSSLHFSSDSGA